MSTGFRVTGTVAAVAAFAIAALVAPAGAIAKKKPDLVIKEAALIGQPFVFSEEENTVTFRDWTKNVGNRMSGKSYTQLLMIRPDGVKRELGDRNIAKLKPDKSSKGSSEEAFTFEPPLGAHTLEVCADYIDEIEEKNERNNCVTLPGYFFVIERIWSGSISGSGCLAPGLQGECSDARETWSSENATFTFDQYLGAGVFNYVYTGTVFYMDSGTDIDDCTWSSGDSANSANGGGSMVLDYLTNQYNATGLVLPFYTYTRDCPGIFGDETRQGPLYDHFLQTSAHSGAPSGTGQPLPFGHFILEGHYEGAAIGNASDGRVTWNWQLQ